MTEPVQGDLLASAAADAEDADARNIFRVDVEGFEGPLHLLLELARKQKVDLLHISILSLADQYLAFIREARQKRMDLAADYLLMAAWLAWLKSKLLLPQEQAHEDEPGGEEMAGRLAFRLARLEAMRKAVKDLEGGRIDGRDVFARGMPERAKVIRTPIWTTSLHDLMKAFGEVNTRKYRAKKHVVKRQPVLALESARRQLVKLAPQLEEWTSVQSIRPPEDVVGDVPRRSVTASLFSAALELARDRGSIVRCAVPRSYPFASRNCRRRRNERRRSARR
ncbi:MAG: ScpA family protein [Hyphomonadaceae bacterium]